MDLAQIISGLKAFDWDKWNVGKNILKPKVYSAECEEVFFNKPVMGEVVLSRKKTERRYYAFGITDSGRKLTIIFTIRGDNKIRVISVRDMSRKERRSYGEESK